MTLPWLSAHMPPEQIAVPPGPDAMVVPSLLHIVVPLMIAHCISPANAGEQKMLLANAASKTLFPVKILHRENIDPSFLSPIWRICFFKCEVQYFSEVELKMIPTPPPLWTQEWLSNGYAKDLGELGTINLLQHSIVPQKFHQSSLALIGIFLKTVGEM
jgi:hypothetical protein